MAAEHLSYSGINRSITDYAGSRACEELINLRPTSDGLMPVRDFYAKFLNRGYDKVFIHHAIGRDVYICVKHTSSSVKVYRVDEAARPTDQELLSISVTGSSASAKEAMAQRIIAGLSFASAGNIALFSVCDKTDNIYGNWTFTWDGSEYDVTEANVPEISVGVSDDGMVGVWQEIPHLSNTSNAADVISAVENGLNAIQELKPNLCMGPIIIAIAFKTRDGNTFWTKKWLMYDPIGTINSASNTPYRDATTQPSPEWADFFNKYGYGYESGYTYGNVLDNVVGYGTEVTVSLGALSDDATDANYWNKETSVIKSVEIYSSRPFLSVDATGAYDGLIAYGNPVEYQLMLPQSKYENMNFENCLFYHQASVPMDALAELGTNETYPVKLTFGGNIQTTNETLRVDAGAVERYGHVLSYNSRFHYYDSVAETEVGQPFFLYQGTATTGAIYAIYMYSDDNKTRLVYGGDMTGKFKTDSDVVIAPSYNIKEVIVYRKITGTYVVYRFRMKESKTYNISICTDGYYNTPETGSGTITEYEDAISNGNKFTTEEQAAINVTEQYNPFVFRVEHSYLAPGRITDLVPQNFVVTDATYGREPLDVFTERGIYALIQGSGDILYAWFDPIDPMVAFGRAVPTEMGIFFLSGGALYLCAGHRVTLVSDALMAGPHKYVRSAGPTVSSVGAYTKIAGSSGLVDMSSYVSAVDFETFAGSGRLSYNRFRQEVFVSNPSYDYTYVLSLKYRQWFKVSQRLWQDEPASVIVSRPGTTSGYVDVLNLETESTYGSVKIHLQTRPFSMGYQYAHIHRAISMIRAQLSGTEGDVAVLHLYGSDDLQNWTLLAYAKRSGSTTGSGDNIQDVPLYISQLRTPTAARSWRYYTICLTGQVPSAGDFQTDVGPFVVDYDAVVRRLG